MRKILLVCTGNTCRSSMAEGFLKNLLSKDAELRKSYTVSSAGIATFDGQPASLNSIRVLADNWGIDIGVHRSKMITEDDIQEAYLILTMTRSHKQSILSIFPDARGKVFTLKEYVSDDNGKDSFGTYNHTLDIVDPYGRSYEVYKSCGQEIYDSILKLVDKLNNQIGE